MALLSLSNSLHSLSLIFFLLCLWFLTTSLLLYHISGWLYQFEQFQVLVRPYFFVGTQANLCAASIHTHAQNDEVTEKKEKKRNNNIFCFYWNGRKSCHKTKSWVLSDWIYMSLRIGECVLPSYQIEANSCWTFGWATNCTNKRTLH